MVSEVKEFLAAMLPEQVAAERRDAQRRRRAPSGPLVAPRPGHPVRRRARRVWLGPRLSADFATVGVVVLRLPEYDFEVVAAGASGDLAYTVGYEHNVVMSRGELRTYTLRVTHVYRREDGQWKIVHRHADAPPAGTATRSTASADALHLTVGTGVDDDT